MEIVGDPDVGLQTDLVRLRERSARRAATAAVAARRVVYSAAGLYAVVFAAAAALHFLVFQSAHADLGAMAQAVWSTSHGHFLETTTLAGRNTTRLAAHVDPFLVLLVPLWWVWSSPLMLVVVQAIAVSTGALPVYWLARKHFCSDRAAVNLALAYLIFPATQFSAFTIAGGFHAVSIAVPLILFAIWFLDEDRLVPFALFALLAASTKEEIPAAVGCLGIWYAVRKGKRLVGLSIFVLGLTVSLADFLVVIPHFSPSGIDPFVGRYQQVGGTPRGILHTAISDPTALVHAVATTHKLAYVLLLLAPMLGLWLLEPLLFLGAIPDLVINLLSGKSDQTLISYPGAAGIVPFAIAATIFGAARLKRDPNRVSLYVLIGVASIAVYSPIVQARSDLSAWSSPA
ncbi:MAG: DUF2079 domain-containing protein, partial [Actinomycetota bacterium]|nr:DUF2079 domain-containing protein [Actinomycetota bacterium]